MRTGAGVCDPPKRSVITTVRIAAIAVVMRHAVIAIADAVRRAVAPIPIAMVDAIRMVTVRQRLFLIGAIGREFAGAAIGRPLIDVVILVHGVIGLRAVLIGRIGQPLVAGREAAA